MDMPRWSVVAYKGNLVYDQADRPMNRETGPDSGWTGEWCNISTKLERDDKKLGIFNDLTSEEQPCWRCGDERVFEASERLANHYVQKVATWQKQNLGGWT
jgi:hypothetical protein